MNKWLLALIFAPSIAFAGDLIRIDDSAVKESFCNWHPSDVLCEDDPVDPPVDPNEPIDPPIDPCIENPESDGCPCPDADGSVYPDCPVDPPVDPNEPVAGFDGGIVYTRIPRTIGTYEIPLKDGEIYELTVADNWDRLPEVSNLLGGFNAPGQMIMRAEDGTEKIIYDCFGKERPCVPLDPSVSFDGKKIIFSVYSSKEMTTFDVSGKEMPNQIMAKDDEEGIIHIYDIETDTLTQWPHSAGTHDNSPIWLTNGDVMFSSNSGGHFSSYLNAIGNASDGVQSRLWIANADGTNRRDISPHEMGPAMHPYLLKSGRVAYGSMWVSGNLMYYYNNSRPNWPTTKNNMWVVAAIDQAGADPTILMGGHKATMKSQTGSSRTAKAFHYVGQLKNDDYCFSNYYRGNNLGHGEIICATVEDNYLLEGPPPKFLPTNYYFPGLWAESGDKPSKTWDDGTYKGKLSWPEGMPDGNLMVSYAQGHCTKVNESMPGLAEEIGDRTGCNVGIYHGTEMPISQPEPPYFLPIVDTEEWHEFGSRMIVAREIEPLPMKQSAKDMTCTVTSSNALQTDGISYQEWDYDGQFFAMGNNGSEIYGTNPEDVVAIRFYEVIPNTNDSNPKNTYGNKLRKFADVPLLDDGSFIAELPCDTPYIMTGINARGELIKKDQLPQSLRPGEKRVCTGCHLHGEDGRPLEESLAYTAEPYVLPESQPIPSFDQTIQPMLMSKCGSCHEVSPELVTWNNLVFDYLQEAIPEAMRFVVRSGQTNPMYRYGLQRPEGSKYVSTMFAASSLLYWKAAGMRMDGNTDDTYPDDIDFGEAHPAALNEEELRIMAEWIDGGSPK